MGRASTKHSTPTPRPRMPLSRISCPALLLALFCSLAPRNWLTTTAPPVASAENSTMIRLLIMSTRLTPEMAASPQRDTIMVSAMPTVTARNCSTSSGQVSFNNCDWVNSGFRPPNSGAFSPLRAVCCIIELLSCTGRIARALPARCAGPSILHTHLS